MDDSTHLKKFSFPKETSLIIVVCAMYDAYVSREGSNVDNGVCLSNIVGVTLRGDDKKDIVLGVSSKRLDGSVASG